MSGKAAIDPVRRRSLPGKTKAALLLGALVGAGAVILACVGEDAGTVPSVGDSGGAAEGAEGGRCFANGTCLAAPLTCLSGVCVRPESNPPGTPPGMPPGTPPEPPGSIRPEAGCGAVPTTGAIPCGLAGAADVCAPDELCCFRRGLPGVQPPVCVLDAGECDLDLGTSIECADPTYCAADERCCAEFASPTAACDLTIKRTSCTKGTCAAGAEICSAKAGCDGQFATKCIGQTARGTGTAGAFPQNVGICRP